MLALIIGAVIAIATTGGGSSPKQSATTPKSTSTASKAKAKPKTTSTPAASTPKTTSTPAASPAPTSDDPVALNNRGYSLYQQGKAGEAVPILQKAVDQFRAQGKKGDVNYAYALYNLGTALLDSGKPADAIPYFQERLDISDDRRELVQSQLNKAQAAAGQPQTKPGKAKGKKKG